MVNLLQLTVSLNTCQHSSDMSELVSSSSKKLWQTLILLTGLMTSGLFSNCMWKIFPSSDV